MEDPYSEQLLARITGSELLDEPSPLILRFLDNDAPRDVHLATGSAQIGRLEGLRLTINASRVSELHAKVFWDAKRHAWFLEDTNSSYGTLLNSKKIKTGKATKLSDRDTITVGGDITIDVEMEPFPENPTLGQLVELHYAILHSMIDAKVEADCIALHKEFLNLEDEVLEMTGLTDEFLDAYVD